MRESIRFHTNPFENARCASVYSITTVVISLRVVDNHHRGKDRNAITRHNISFEAAGQALAARGGHKTLNGRESVTHRTCCARFKRLDARREVASLKYAQHNIHA